MDRLQEIEERLVKARYIVQGLNNKKIPVHPTIEEYADDVGWLLEELEKSRRDNRLLMTLKAAGVDNWEGYEDALQRLESEQ